MNKRDIKKREYNKPFVGMTVIEMEAQLLAGSNNNGGNKFTGGNKPADEGPQIGDAKDGFFDDED